MRPRAVSLYEVANKKTKKSKT